MTEVANGRIILRARPTTEAEDTLRAEFILASSRRSDLMFYAAQTASMLVRRGVEKDTIITHPTGGETRKGPFGLRREAETAELPVWSLERYDGFRNSGVNGANKPYKAAVLGVYGELYVAQPDEADDYQLKQGYEFAVWRGLPLLARATIMGVSSAEPFLSEGESLAATRLDEQLLHKLGQIRAGHKIDVSQE